MDASSQLSYSNRPRNLNPSPLSAVTTAQDDYKLITESIVNSVGSIADGFDIKDVDLFSSWIITDAYDNQLKKKKARQTSKSDAQKWANLADEIFDFIYLARCKRFFALA